MWIRARIRLHELHRALVVASLQVFVSEPVYYCVRKQNGFGIALASLREFLDGLFDAAGMVNEFKEIRLGGCGRGCLCTDGRTLSQSCCDPRDDHAGLFFVGVKHLDAMS